MQQAMSSTSIPTLPAILSLSSAAHDRRALLAALLFVDRPPRSPAALAGWFDKHLVAPGRMARPASVTEGFSQPVALGSADASEMEESSELSAIVEAARHRVLVSLRAFMPPASEDRFLVAAIDEGRVRRSGDARWEACPGEWDLLSDIVLSLFAADILSYREFHDAYLCVCKTCLRIDFDPSRSGRTGCPEHLPTEAGAALRRTPSPI
jgi:hypothetical protein